MRTRERDTRAFGLGYAILAPLYLAPLFVTKVLPGLDLGFHLAMADALAKGGDPGSPYAPFYDAQLAPYPYAAHLGALALLGHVMTLVHAHTFLTALYVAGLPLAVSSALAACGKSRIPALLAFPVAYNLTLHYGFVSFAFSLPLTFLLIAAMARYMASFARPRRDLLVLVAGAAVLLYLCHLQNFLYGLLAAGCFVVFVRATIVRRALGLAALVPSCLALVAWRVGTRFQDDPADQRHTLAYAWDYVVKARLVDKGPKPWLEDFRDRCITLPRILLKGFTDGSHLTGARLVLMAMAVYLLLGLAGFLLPGRSPRRFKVAAGLVAFGAALAFFGLPHHLPAYELQTFFPRFAPLLVLTGLLVLPSGLRRYRGRGGYALLLPALAVGVLYGTTLVDQYRAFGAETADFIHVLDKAEPGGRAVGVLFDRHSAVVTIESPFVALPSYYVAYRPAPTSMTAVTYCGYRHMPCRRTGVDPPAPHPWIPTTFNPDLAVPFYDWFFVRSGPSANVLFGARATEVELAASRGTWALYRKKR